MQKGVDVRNVLNKLVRDKITETLEKKGIRYKAAKVRKLERALLRKLNEEIGKLVRAQPKDRVEEFADVLEVLEALAQHWNLRMQKIRKSQKRKRKTKGGFSKGILLFWIDESKEK